MGLNVEQDSGKLREIAEKIRQHATDLNNNTKLINDAMNNRLGPEPSDVLYWFGPNAAAFLKDFNDKYPQKFTNAYNNVVSMAANLESQAEQWEKFESQ